MHLKCMALRKRIRDLKPKCKTSLGSWSSSALNYCVKHVVPLPVYREVKPSYGFLIRNDVPLSALHKGQSWASKLKFNLVHLVYTVKRHMPGELERLNFNFKNFGKDLKLERIFLYFRLLQKILPNRQSRNGDIPVGNEGHAQGEYPSGILTSPELSSEHVPYGSVSEGESISEFSNSYYLNPLIRNIRGVRR